MRNSSHVWKQALVSVILTTLTMASCTSVDSNAGKGGRGDPYATYVWPPPPDAARIRLVDVLCQRLDVEAESAMSRVLIGASPRGPYDRLQRPMGVAIDRQGRIIVTDMKLGALLRFDREGRALDVFGTTGTARLIGPISVEVTHEDTILVADGSQRRIIEYDSEGNVLRAYGRSGELENPTDAALSPDGTAVYVCDSRRHEIVVFDRASAAIVDRFGRRGEAPGEFNYPTAIAFANDGSLFVVDQMNARVQILSSDGEFLESFGGRGTGFGKFVRPKDIAIDPLGFIYVTDAAFNNVQIFNADLELLTFVGRGGSGPGEFQIAGGVAADEHGFVVVDQLGKRVQVFRYLQPRGARSSDASNARTRKVRE